MDFWDFTPAKYTYNAFKQYVEPSISDWLYGDYNEEKLRQFQVAYSIPGVRNYMDYLLDRRSDQEYLSRYGMDYSDIHDPRKLRQTSSGSRVISSVSSNVARLYE